MERTINVEINGQFVKKDSKNGGVMGEGNVTAMHITFDGSWTGYGKRIVWRDANGENPVSVVLFEPVTPEEGQDPLTADITIPAEPLAVPGWCSFSIEGYKEEDGVHKVSFSVSDHLFVAESDSYNKPAEPTPSQTQQILEKLGNVIQEVQGVGTEAKSWAVGGTGTREGEDTDNSKYYAGEASKSAKESATGADNAKQSSNSAKEFADSANAASKAAAEFSDSASRSATHASNSEQGASDYARSAGESAAAAQQSANSAAQSAQGAGTSAGNAQASANAAAEATKHYPRINPATMTWFLWDPEKGEFVDTGVIAEGRNGIEADGLWGVYVDEEGFLVVTYTGDDPPPLSISDDGYLVYTLNGQEIRVGKTVGPVGPAGPAGLGVPEATPEDADKIPIVAPDGTYKLGYQSGAIDDTKVQTDKTWSSLQIVDTLAPEFESSGTVVTCTPVAGYPLHVVSQIVPVQEGSGDPSPENVRPISGWTQATLTHNDTPVTLPFGQTVYGGTLDWTTGVLTVGSIFLKLDTTYTIDLYQYQGKNGVSFLSPLLYRPNRIEGVCSHGICTTYSSISNESWIWIGVNNPLVYWVGILDVLGLSTVDEFKSWLDTQDVQIVYPMQEPVTIQLTPQEILALSGTNTIYTDTGDTTVSGRAAPNAIIQQLAARIAALEGAATNL